MGHFLHFHRLELHHQIAVSFQHCQSMNRYLSRLDYPQRLGQYPLPLDRLRVSRFCDSKYTHHQSTWLNHQ